MPRWSAAFGEKPEQFRVLGADVEKLLVRQLPARRALGPWTARQGARAALIERFSLRFSLHRFRLATARTARARCAPRIS